METMGFLENKYLKPPDLRQAQQVNFSQILLCGDVLVWLLKFIVGFCSPVRKV